MKKRTKITSWILLLAMLIAMIQPLCDTEAYQAATSYTNAKEFYESTTQANGSFHVDTAYGRVYYATQAKLASSSTNTRYYTVGFDVTLSGNGHSVSFTVQRKGGSMTQVDSKKDSTYEYLLYEIDEKNLFELATKADSTNAAYVLGASTISVQMDAIMTTISAGSTTPNGDITENGYGGFTKRGTIYRLKNSANLKAMKEIFSGHTFESYKGIKAEIKNYLLKVRYNVLGLNPTGNSPTLSNSSFKFDATGLLQESGSTYFDESRTLKKITLLNTGTSGIGLSKTGYHLPSGKEWVTDNSRYFASNGTYQSTTVDPLVGYQNHGITLYANWKPNEYAILYNSNGGNGTVPSSNMTYDTASNLRENTFTRTGYYLPEGKEWIDADGNTYASGASVKNLATSNGAQITLYANWVPCVYQITLDKQEGNGGTDYFFEKYGLGFYLSIACTSSITSISIPSKLGHEFQGYFSSVRGAGEQIIGKNGLILSRIPFSYFTKDTTIFADWKAKQFTITFDKQGGTGGADSAIATYGKLLPSADGPIRTGYTFEGYYLDEAFEDKDKEYYTQHMVPTTLFLFEKDITLSAKWVDDILPTASICVSTSSWTNKADGIDVVATAYDLGKGLDRVELYCGDSLVDSKTGLNGTNDVVEIAYVHKKEGAYRYRVIAYDTEGNIAEAYETCLYDITAPSGEYTVENDDVTDFKIIVDTLDYNISP